VTQQEVNSTISELLYEDFKKKYQQEQSKVLIRFIPTTLELIAENSYLPIAQSFLHHPMILSRVDRLRVFLYQNN
jgi:hypothetical protein